MLVDSIIETENKLSEVFRPLPSCPICNGTLEHSMWPASSKQGNGNNGYFFVVICSTCGTIYQNARVKEEGLFDI